MFRDQVEEGVELTRDQSVGKDAPDVASAAGVDGEAQARGGKFAGAGRWVLLGCAGSLINLLTNQSLYQGGLLQQFWIFVLGALMVSGLLCLFWSVLRAWTLVFVGLLLVLQIPQTAMLMLFQARLTPFVISAMLDSAPSETTAYVNATNTGIAILGICAIGALLYGIKRILPRQLSRWRFARNGLVFSALAGVLLLVSGASGANLKSLSAGMFWMFGEPAKLVGNYKLARAADAELTRLCKDLPSPAQLPSSCPHDDRQDGLTVVIHIGESTRADMLSLNGYERPTTPFLSQYERIANFPACVSVAGDTCLAQIAILTGSNTPLHSENGSVLDLMKKHRFELVTFNGQLSSMNVKFDMVFKQLTAATSRRFYSPGLMPTILPLIGGELAKNPGKNRCIVINNEGNHTPFSNFDPQNAPFQPVCTTFDNPRANAQAIINAYDNCTVLLDSFIRDLTSKTLKGRPFLYIYIGDHGEYLGHGGLWGRGALGDSHVPYHQTTGCLVPFFFLWSEELTRLYPEKAALLANLQKNSALATSHANFLHTLLGLLEISSPIYKAESDLSSPVAKPYEGEMPEAAWKNAG